MECRIRERDCNYYNRLLYTTDKEPEFLPKTTNVLVAIQDAKEAITIRKTNNALNRDSVSLPVVHNSLL